MKIVLATPIYPPDIGGPATYAQKLKQGFEGRGISTTVVSYGNLRKIPQPLRIACYVAKLLKASLGADAIYAFNAISCGIPACFCGKILRKRFFIRLGGDFLWERAVEQGRIEQTVREYSESSVKTLRGRLTMFSIGKILKSTDKIIFTSDFQRQIYFKHYGFRPEKTVIIKNPFPEVKEAPLQTTPENYKILYAGRLLKLKNLEFLIKVFYNVLSNTDKPLMLKIIGEGPEKTNLIKYDKVTFASPLPHQELMAEMGRSYICVLPSLTEITPNFALECLAMGKPVLLTKETGLDTVGNSLILIDPRDGADLERKILYLLDEKNYADYVEKIKKIPMNYTWNDVVKEHEKSFISRSN